ncbi:MAG: hypothetical protein AAF355_08365 [Myxococcota bacterium]
MLWRYRVPSLNELKRGPWLFGLRADLMAFGGSAMVAAVLVLYGATTQLLERELSLLFWLVLIVGIDVAHVWATAYRVYLDPDELRSRRLLYLGMPLVLYFINLILYAISPSLFWRCLAYAAVFHFVRQQLGWVLLYRRKAGESASVDAVLDRTAVYAATVYPLLHWHAHLPRNFYWFVEGDFVTGVRLDWVDALEPLYWAVLAIFVLRQLHLFLRGVLNPGKILVVSTTWFCWWLGIIALDSDYAFTVTNVVIHGVPYMVLNYTYARQRARQNPSSAGSVLTSRGWFIFLLSLVFCALLEETLWDRWVYHDRPAFFGTGSVFSGQIVALLAPALALPQTLHYFLDGVIWRTRRRTAKKHVAFL